jgi:protein transport protein SEC61 subunit gamma and related proteins
MEQNDPVQQPEEKQQQAPQPVQQQTQQQPVQPQSNQPYKETYITKFKKFIREAKRVMKVTRKPNRQEFITIAKVSAIGLAVVGLLGFMFTMLQHFII